MNIRHQLAGAALAAIVAAGAAAQESGGLDAVAVPSAGGDVAVRSFMQEAKSRGESLDGEAASRIFGGRPAQEGAWPWQVSLHDAPRLDGTSDGLFQSQFCGGTLIARQWILTAAHCVVGEDGRALPPEALMIRSGSVDLDRGDLRAVARVIPHERYDPVVIENDIALLQLAQPISESSGPVGAISVATSGAALPTGPAVVVGWGMMEEGKFPASLMETDIDIVSNDTCNRGMAEQTKRDMGSFLLGMGATNRIPEDALEQAFSILVQNLGPSLTENMICAGVPSGERTSCNGDSGGPLMVQDPSGSWLQVGIVSWGREPLDASQRCAHQDLFSVYTRVGNYFDWIASYVRG